MLSLCDISHRARVFEQVNRFLIVGLGLVRQSETLQRIGLLLGQLGHTHAIFSFPKRKGVVQVSQRLLMCCALSCSLSRQSEVCDCFFWIYRGSGQKREARVR